MLSDIAISKYYDIDKDISRCKCLPEDTSIALVNAAIKESGLGFCCLCNKYGKVNNVVYGSDIEQLIKLGKSETAAYEIKSHNILLQSDSPVFDINIDYLFYIFPHKFFPVVDSEGEVVAVVKNKRIPVYPVKKNPVVIMAGGLGMRLRPYTEKIPKPLLTVGGVSILERILSYFHYYGFRTIYISVNYLAEQIKDTIGDGSRFGLNIRYLQEKKWLGTAGAIALMPKPSLPCIVSNGDLIMDVDLHKFLNMHQELHASGTMCTYCYTYKIAYGVVQSQNGEYQGITEKPTHRFQVNTGLYPTRRKTSPFRGRI